MHWFRELVASLAFHIFLVVVFVEIGRTAECNPLSLHDALPIFARLGGHDPATPHAGGSELLGAPAVVGQKENRSEEHTSELQSRGHLVCRLLLEKKKHHGQQNHPHHPTHPDQTTTDYAQTLRQC